MLGIQGAASLASQELYSYIRIDPLTGDHNRVELITPLRINIEVTRRDQLQADPTLVTGMKSSDPYKSDKRTRLLQLVKSDGPLCSN